MTPEARAAVDEIEAIWREVGDTDQDSLDRLLSVVYSQAEMVRAALRARAIANPGKQSNEIADTEKRREASRTS